MFKVGAPMSIGFSYGVVLGRNLGGNSGLYDDLLLEGSYVADLSVFLGCAISYCFGVRLLPASALGHCIRT